MSMISDSVPNPWEPVAVLITPDTREDVAFRHASMHAVTGGGTVDYGDSMPFGKYCHSGKKTHGKKRASSPRPVERCSRKGQVLSCRGIWRRS